MTTAKVIIPFRDRGLDARRGANLEVVMAWWWAHGLTPEVVDDGLTGDAQFNRHRAYNRAVAANPNVDVFIFTEADMLIPIPQIAIATKLAIRRPGLIVPFMQYRYLSDESTAKVRDYFHDLEPQELAQWMALDHMNPTSIFMITPESTMDNGASIGAVNVVSRETLEITGGFTEATSGNWYDDNIIEEGFTYLTQQRTSFVPGPAVHMYHLPGWKGDHLTEEDKAATQRNKDILVRMRADVLMRNSKGVRDLMAVRQEASA
jgi:hypothetical protein